MLSQPTTKFILRTAEPNAAKWAAEMIGEVEIERVRETVADGKRQGKSFTLDRQIEPLVMKSEVEGLPDLHAFVKINNYVSRFSFPPMSLPKIAEALQRRKIAPNTRCGSTAGTCTVPGRRHSRSPRSQSVNRRNQPNKGRSP